jgi:hypothetical protein
MRQREEVGSRRVEKKTKAPRQRMSESVATGNVLGTRRREVERNKHFVH